ncbi:MAG TPA: ribosome assembly RNA-binding protein YhbY [Clostridia bacterium]|jgi:RNA-binding protein|nr:ribosome assembly RNA-binding protein YhbY [Clostridiaceae bacterium]HOF25964.1 ribosome assembly RNA-binding protein YhbY [Clostridia bacterium]HOM33593.1 ribosome assembly RNA-binding protein YhbY [Clostridia bacterium]HOR88989.1 ribosome assembly RNA-binding protein YhbY [Clostridia bacterium]HOT70639.1 ribosome assembly RNA-binding protein YhbY [Clostridia bacterium]
MITSKQRAYLKGLAQKIQPIIQLGKDGISENTLIMYKEALEARELVKTTVLKSCEYEPLQVANDIAEAIGAEVVQVIGNKFVLYKQSREKKRINLDL